MAVPSHRSRAVAEPMLLAGAPPGTAPGSPGLARRPSDWRLLRVVLAKHFYVAWRRKRFIGMLVPTVMYSALICGGWHLLRQVGNVGFMTNSIALLAPVYLVFSMNQHLQLALVDIVAEKEDKLKVVQAINGLPARIYWLAWFLYFMATGVICILVTLAIVSVGSRMFAHSNILLIFAIFLLSYAQTFATACCFSIVFDRAETASRISQLVTMVMFGLATGVNALLRGAGASVFVIASMIPVVGIFSALTSALWLESQGKGVTFATLSTNCCAPGLEGQPEVFFPAGASMAMLGVDVVGYFIFCWWLDHVWQGEFGIAKPPLFCMRNLWSCLCRCRRQTAARELWPTASVELQAAAPVGATAPLEGGLATGIDEGGRPIALSIQELVKEYKGKPAVKGLTLQVYTGEIFALLGHNGAGKTTTLNCLVGLIPPTSGTLHVNGISVREDIDQVRQNISLCPQDSPMYNEFTVDRHLNFFATLRGVEQPSEEVPRVLQALGLMDKRYSLGKSLSGGQKRRLWVATAVLGDAPIIFLDEPTSGMDPSARRDLWDLLHARRGSGRSIIFTTHYLEEADILADRKAVLARGQVQAVGTSRELKLRFGVGYHLEIEQDAQAATLQDRSLLGALVRRHVPQAGEPEGHQSMRRAAAPDAPAVFDFELPYGEIDAFGPLLAELEQRSQELGVWDYSLQMTSLEEVFMKLGREDAEAQQEPSHAPESPAPSGQRSSSSFSVGWSSGPGSATNMREAPTRSAQGAVRGAWALVRVRWRCLANNRRRLLQQIVIPTILMLVSMGYRTPGNAAENPYIAIYGPLGFSILTSFFAVVVMLDKENKCKFVALSQGLPTLSYWGGTFIFDYVVTLPIIFEVPLMIVLLDQPHLAGPALPLIIVECFAYAFSLIVFGYYLTCAFTTIEAMLKYMPLFNMALGILPSVAVYELALQGHKSPTCAAAADLLHYSMSLLNPMYGLSGVLIYAIHLGILGEERVGARDYHVPRSALAFFFSSAAAPLYLSLATATGLACQILRRDRGDGTRGRVAPLGRGAAESPAEGAALIPLGDDDVLAESRRIHRRMDDGTGSAEQAQESRATNLERDVVIYQDLRHTYPAKGGTSAAPVRAVRGITLGIRRGECFGLLGPNGAGKTTTLSILTGELWPPTAGRVLIDGVDVEAEGFGTLYRQLGNCPQVDPLWGDLSGRDHLLFHGRIKGVPEAALRVEVEELLQRLGLAGADARKKAKEYSGGMKRKLSVGIALIGHSEILLLDEPSAAVDAAAKRYLWRMIKGRSSSQTALVTTHSMEEAEALCERLTIQVLGQLRCLGSPIHIRHKYGKGYQLELFLDGSSAGSREDVRETLEEFVCASISEKATMVEAHGGRCLFQLPPMDGSAGSTSLSRVFTEVSRARRRLCIAEYGLWRPSLEQVFLRFAREQQEAEESEAGEGPSSPAAPPQAAVGEGLAAA